MLIWVIISIFLLASFAYLITYLKHIDFQNAKGCTQNFSDVRQAEIKEELTVGRLSTDEAQQLTKDLKIETNLANKQVSHTYYDAAISPFAIKVFAVFIALTLLGSVALYQTLGFNNEVMFTDKLRQGTTTPADVSEFLSYRAQKYQAPQDWYWFGEDLLNQKNYVAASQAFAKALNSLTTAGAVESQDELAILIAYSQSLFFENNQKPTPELERVLARILTINPNQTDALGLQGVVAFEKANFKEAILLWQKAIRAGAGISERASLLDGIAKAREVGNISNQQIPELITHRIKVKASLNNPEKLTNDALFLVYAKTAQQPMPVAIKRILPNQLNNVIELTNLDNLMPGASLQDLSKVDVVVKLTSIHAQDLTKGKDVALVKNLSVNSSETVNIAIQL
ncbi:hypothetical protein CBF23_005520 [Marinomonas agarivorans]|nr:hypothetical protein CBF23_005520 [Marinomonas agarivorans]